MPGNFQSQANPRRDERTLIFSFLSLIVSFLLFPSLLLIPEEWKFKQANEIYAGILFSFLCREKRESTGWKPLLCLWLRSIASERKAEREKEREAGTKNRICCRAKSRGKKSHMNAKQNHLEMTKHLARDPLGTIVWKRDAFSCLIKVSREESDTF